MAYACKYAIFSWPILMFFWKHCKGIIYNRLVIRFDFWVISMEIMGLQNHYFILCPFISFSIFFPKDQLPLYLFL